MTPISLKVFHLLRGTTIWLEPPRKLKYTVQFLQKKFLNNYLKNPSIQQSIDLIQLIIMTFYIANLFYQKIIHQSFSKFLLVFSKTNILFKFRAKLNKYALTLPDIDQNIINLFIANFILNKKSPQTKLNRNAGFQVISILNVFHT